MRSRASRSMKLRLCRAPSCAGVSFTVAMALSSQIAVRAYRAVAKAFGAKAVRAYRVVAMALSRQNCESESR